ncbi:hypothetical protein ACT8ZS_02880 [Paenibacillus sp. M.A.Huq-84]
MLPWNELRITAAEQKVPLFHLLRQIRDDSGIVNSVIRKKVQLIRKNEEIEERMVPLSLRFYVLFGNTGMMASAIN